MTTSLAYEELLAFEGLQDAVDQLYRAYLDAEIVEAKRTYKSDPPGYWKKLKDFRTTELDPGTRLEYPDKAKRRKRKSANFDDLAKQRQANSQRSAFIYWFDVRAQFWLSYPENSPVLDVYPYAKELVLLNAQAAALIARLERLKEIYEKRQQVTSDSSAFDKLQRQIESTVRSSVLAQRVTAAHQQELARRLPKRRP